jgi:3-oxoacyl-[acyl-carrier-protein] synthase-3
MVREQQRKQPSGIGILGIGSFVPEGELTNYDLEKIVDTSDKWIRERTGIFKRHRSDENTATSDLAAGAAREAMADAGVEPGDIDIIIVGTATPDMFFPSTACHVQKALGASNAAAFDISAACSGFLYGLSLAENYIATGTHDLVAVIGAETLTKILDWSDRTTCVLFGDGAGAAIVGRVSDGRGFVTSRMGSDGTLNKLIMQPGGGSRVPPTEETLRQGLHYIKLQGNKVFKAAVKAMASVALETLEDAGYTNNDLDLLVPHQANWRIIDATARRIKVPPEKVFSNVEHYGNTSAASIPIALSDAKRQGILKEGMLVEMVSFGAGLTWASNLMIW